MTLKDKIVLRDSHGHYLPGTVANPSGRPPVRVSMLKLLEDTLSNDSTAKAIIDALVKKCVEQRDVPAISLVFDRIDGKVASEVNVKALIVNIGDEYAQQGLEAIRQELLSKQERYALAEGNKEG